VLFQVLGFSANAATYITGTEDANSLEELEILEDTDVHNLCETVYSNPGGLIANPNMGAAGQPAQIRNPGIPISTNLKLASYYLRHLHRVHRTATSGMLTLVTVRNMRSLKVHEKEHKNPDDLVHPHVD
jgi:hypothetical protein